MHRQKLSGQSQHGAGDDGWWLEEMAKHGAQLGTSRELTYGRAGISSYSMAYELAMLEKQQAEWQS